MVITGIVKSLPVMVIAVKGAMPPTTPPKTTLPVPAVNVRSCAPLIVLVGPLKVMLPPPVFVVTSTFAPTVTGPVIVILLFVVARSPLSVVLPAAV